MFNYVNSKLKNNNIIIIYKSINNTENNKCKCFLLKKRKYKYNIFNCIYFSKNDKFNKL